MKKKAKQLTISVALHEKFAQFIEYAPPARFSRNLRNLLLWYLVYEPDVPPFNMNELAADLQLLFELLDMATETIVAQSEES